MIPFAFHVLLFSIVWLFGLATNCILLYVLSTWRYTKLKISSSTRVLLLNLTVCDLICLTLVPFIYLWLHFHVWHFGLFMCKFVPYVRFASMTVISFTLAAIGIQWYNSPVVKHWKEAITLRQTLLMCAAIWTMAVVMSLPTYFLHRLEMVTPVNSELDAVIIEEVDMDAIAQLLENLNQSISSTKSKLARVQTCLLSTKWTHIVAYHFQILFIQHLTPVAICVYTYTRIVYLLWWKKDVTLEQEIMQSEMKTADRKIIKMMLICTSIVIFFFILHQLMNIIAIHIDPYLFLNDFFRLIFVLSLWLGEMHIFYKPLVYFCVNDNFRNVLYDLFSRANGLERLRDEQLINSSDTDGQFNDGEVLMSQLVFDENGNEDERDKNVV